MDSERDKNRALILGYIEEARQCHAAKDYGKAFAFYLLLLKLVPSLKLTLKDEFCESWHEWSKRLLVMEKYQQLLELYQQACDEYYDCDELHLTMGACYYRMGHIFGAYNMYIRTVKVNSHNLCAHESLDNLCAEMIDNWHYSMLNDHERHIMFYNAIQDAIMSMKGTAAVLDIGSGTGILSMFAAQSGANHVTACESCPIMSELGKEIIEGNGFETKITSVNCMSTDLTKQNYVQPCRVGLVITETFDAGGFGEGIIKTVDHAWKNLLLPVEQGGLIIPGRIRIKCVCMESEEIRRKHCLENNWMTQKLPDVQIISSVGCFDSTGKHSIQNGLCQTEPYTSEKLQKLKHKLLSEYHTVMMVDFNNPAEVEKIAKDESDTVLVQIIIRQEGYCDAIATCFELSVDAANPPKYLLKTDIDSSTCWEQAVYPLRCIGKNNEQCSAGRNRILVFKNDQIFLKFIPKHDKLLLTKCTIKRNDSEISYSQMLQSLALEAKIPPCIILKEDEITCLNDSVFWDDYYETFVDWYHTKIQKQHCTTGKLNNPNSGDVSCQNTGHDSNGAICKNSCTVHEITNGFSNLGLRIAADIPGVSVHKSSHDSASERSMEQIANFLDLKNIEFSQSMNVNSKFDAIVMNPVDSNSGLLQRCIFENIQEIRSSLKPGGKIFPMCVDIMVVLVESAELMKNCAVSSNEVTMGLKIGHYLNRFQVLTRSHFDMNKMEYTSLTEPHTAMTLRFDKEESSFMNGNQETCLQITRSGVVNGVLIWFLIKLDEKRCLNTSDAENPWLQSAIVLKEKDFKVTRGSNITLTMHCNRGYIALELNNVPA